MEREEVAERRCGRHLAGDMAWFQPVDLVDRDHYRDLQAEDPLGDEPIAGADALAAVEHEQDGVDVVERAVDRALHALGEGVQRPLESGHVDEHELVVVAVGDAEDPPAGGLRLVGDDDHLGAAERVDERGLADIRAGRRRPRTPTSQLERVGQQVGRSRHHHFPARPRVHHALDAHLHEPLPAAAARRGRDRDRLQVARPAARGDGRRQRRLLRAHPERIGGVLDVDAEEDAAVPARAAAPTRKREYGAYARADTATACS